MRVHMLHLGIDQWEEHGIGVRLIWCSLKNVLKLLNFHRTLLYMLASIVVRGLIFSDANC
jgi:hypothetical protein